MAGDPMGTPTTPSAQTQHIHARGQSSKRVVAFAGGSRLQMSPLGRGWSHLGVLEKEKYGEKIREREMALHSRDLVFVCFFRKRTLVFSMSSCFFVFPFAANKGWDTCDGPRPHVRGHGVRQQLEAAPEHRAIDVHPWGREIIIEIQGRIGKFGRFGDAEDSGDLV